MSDNTFSLSRRLTAEALGTGLIVCTVVGAGVMAQALTRDVGLQLLANALPTGAMLVVLITLLGPVSGAHFNPAVSLVMALSGQLKRQELAAYAGAQIAGGVAGVVGAHLMFDRTLLSLSTTVRFGPSQWFAESVAAFGLVLTILLGIRHRVEAVPWLVGLYISAAYWFTASTSFANPAVTLARALTDSFAGIRPIDVPAFVLAQIAGAILALLFCRWLIGKQAAPA